jgi:hypothetical protein
MDNIKLENQLFNLHNSIVNLVKNNPPKIEESMDDKYANLSPEDDVFDQSQIEE